MLNKALLYLILSGGIMLLFPSCGKNKDVLSRDKMEKVLYDIRLTQAIYDVKYEAYNTDEGKKALFDAVLAKHGITQAVLDSSLVWYADNMSVMLRINDSVAARLRRDKIVFDRKYEEEMLLSRKSDKKKLFATYFRLSGSEPTYSFRLDSANTKNINISSIYNISFQALGISPAIELLSSVRLQYSDTSVVIPFDFVESPFGDRAYHAEILPFDTLQHTLVDISGYVRVNTAYPDFNVLIHDIRFMEKDSLAVFASDRDETGIKMRNKHRR